MYFNIIFCNSLQKQTRIKHYHHFKNKSTFTYCEMLQDSMELGFENSY